jgi:GNAT superfamily N-acetyltransferase
VPIPAETVAAASRAWVWVPPSATKVETDEYLLLRMPEWFGIGLELMRLDPRRPVGEVVDEVLERAREFGLPEVNCWVKLHNDPSLDAVLQERGGVLDETLAVLALDLAHGVPDLGPLEALDTRWATDLQTMRDSLQVGADVFGDAMPPEDEIAAEVERAQQDAETGSGSVVAYLDGVPVGSGGISLVDGVARLWGGAVREQARGKGAYRALLEARLRRGVERGATMALVKGRIQTSGPILRRAGFATYGEERSYRVPLR